MANAGRELYYCTQPGPLELRPNCIPSKGLEAFWSYKKHSILYVIPHVGNMNATCYGQFFTSNSNV